VYLADDFRHALDGFDLEHLAATRSAVIGLRPNLTIAFANRALREGEGGLDAPAPGSSYLDGVPGPIRPFYSGLFHRVQRTGEPAVHEFELPCEDVVRRFRLRVMPLSGGLLLIRHQVASTPMGRQPSLADRTEYVDADGLVHQCAHCRMVLRLGENTWDWVPEWVAEPPSIMSHGLCPVCFRHYYPELAGRYLEWRSQGAG
jgi:hypothetical protein